MTTTTQIAFGVLSVLLAQDQASSLTGSLAVLRPKGAVAER
jgi:hypothetical protein